MAPATTGEYVWDPARGHVLRSSNAFPGGQAPKVETIPFSKETPAPEVFAAAARTTKAANVKALAEAMKGVGIPSEEIPMILTDVRKAAMLRTAAKSLGIELPRDLTRTVEDLQQAMAAGTDESLAAMMARKRAK
jgi:hypothetical protein